MAPATASAQARIAAPADLVLEIIRDFDGHHRHILPPAFSDFLVEKGGVGAGTVTSFVAPTLLRRIYRQELGLLDDYAREIAGLRAAAVSGDATASASA